MVLADGDLEGRPGASEGLLFVKRATAHERDGEQRSCRDRAEANIYIGHTWEEFEIDPKVPVWSRHCLSAVGVGPLEGRTPEGKRESVCVESDDDS